MDLRGLAALSSRTLSLLNGAENLRQDGLELFGYPASVKSEASTREPAIFTRSPSRRFCPPKQIGQRGDRWHGLPNAKVISRWCACFGKMHLEIHDMVMTRMKQLAIYCEHKARDPVQARQVVEQAINELRDAILGDITPGAYREIKARSNRRMVRLERKTRKPLLDTLTVRDFGTRRPSGT
jgi:hypothetical protein